MGTEYATDPMISGLVARSSMLRIKHFMLIITYDSNIALAKFDFLNNLNQSDLIESIDVL